MTADAFSPVSTVIVRIARVLRRLMCSCNFWSPGMYDRLRKKRYILQTVSLEYNAFFAKFYRDKIWSGGFHLSCLDLFSCWTDLSNKGFKWLNRSIDFCRSRFGLGVKLFLYILVVCSSLFVEQSTQLISISVRYHHAAKDPCCSICQMHLFFNSILRIDRIFFLDLIR